jgi:hypothetical protein
MSSIRINVDRIGAGAQESGAQGLAAGSATRGIYLDIEEDREPGGKHVQTITDVFHRRQGVQHDPAPQPERRFSFIRVGFPACIGLRKPVQPVRTAPAFLHLGRRARHYRPASGFMLSVSLGKAF